MPIRANYRHTQYACYLGYITQAIVNNLAPLLFVIFQQNIVAGMMSGSVKE